MHPHVTPNGANARSRPGTVGAVPTPHDASADPAPPCQSLEDLINEAALGSGIAQQLREHLGRTHDDNLVAWYIRVSTERQEREKTAETQIAGLIEWCEKHGYRLHSIGQIWLDNGYTAEHLRRPRLSGLRRAVKAGTLPVRHVVLCWYDRLSKDRIDPHIVRREMEQRGVSLLYGDRDNSGSQDGEMTSDLLDTINYYSRRMLKAKTGDGREKALRVDKEPWYVNPPYGIAYAPRDRKTGKGGLSVIEDLRPHVVRIYEWAGLERRSTVWIAAELNRLGIKTAAGGKWYPRQVSRLIQRTIYRGVYTADEWEACLPHHAERALEKGEDPQTFGKGTGRTSTRRRPAGQSFDIPQPQCRVVSDSLWSLANEALAARRTAPGGRPLAQLQMLRGLVYCGSAHGTKPEPPKMATNPRNKKDRERRYGYVYQCQWRDHAGHDQQRCRNHITCSRLDDAVWDYIVQKIGAPDEEMDPVRQLAAERRSAAERLTEDLARVTSLHDRLQTALDRLAADYYLRADDDVFREQYERLYPQMKADYAAARQRKQTLQAQLEAAEAQAAEQTHLLALCQHLRDRIANATLEEKTRMAQMLLHGVIYYDDGTAFVDGKIDSRVLTAHVGGEGKKVDSREDNCQASPPFVLAFSGCVTLTADMRARSTGALCAT